MAHLSNDVQRQQKQAEKTPIQKDRTHVRCQETPGDLEFVYLSCFSLQIFKNYSTVSIAG